MAEEITKDLGKKILDKLNDHDKLFVKIDNALVKITNKLLDHDDRFEKLETDLKTDLKDFMLTHFDEIYEKLEKLEQEYRLLNSAVKRLEERMDKIEKRLGSIEGKMVSREELGAVKKQVLDLLSRIEKLESKVGV